MGTDPWSVNCQLELHCQAKSDCPPGRARSAHDLGLVRPCVAARFGSSRPSLGLERRKPMESSTRSAVYVSRAVMVVCVLAALMSSIRPALASVPASRNATLHAQPDLAAMALS